MLTECDLDSLEGWTIKTKEVFLNSLKVGELYLNTGYPTTLINGDIKY